MAIEVGTAIAVVGPLMAIFGGGVALFNAWKTVAWKRAELANAYMKEFTNNEELVFASRCLDWNAGRLVVPEKLCAYLPSDVRIIEYDPSSFARALIPSITVNDLIADPRIQIYRTCIDSFLSWLSLIASGLDRRLFLAKDIQDVSYWLNKVRSHQAVLTFAQAYGYSDTINRLRRHYTRKSPTERIKALLKGKG
jgi:hypothetical protein